MYSNQFQKIPTIEVVDTIKEKGYFFFEEALCKEFIDQLLSTVDFDEVLVNKNDVGAVISGTQRFLTHCLAKSKSAYDLITSTKVLDICNAFFTERYQLTNHRFCQTRRTFHMPWHTDNNLQLEGQLTGKHSMPGLLFLFYLSDQNISPFQYIKDSHNWSHQYDNEIYLTEQWVETNYQSDVLTFKMPKGSLMICDIHGIHRALPFCDRNHTRNILLFQVDQIGEHYVGHGEQNLVNTAFIDNPSPELFSYLGFGVKRDYPAFPSSSVATMSVQDMLSLQKQIIPSTLKGLAKQAVKAIIPGEKMVSLKRKLWELKSQN